jgi:N-acetylglutamate synthase-like GNAT family acetyltransferase
VYLNERDQIREATIKDTDAIKNYRDIVSKESSYINNPAKIRIRETIERYTNDSSRDYYILIQDKEIVGSITTHIDSIRGCLYIEHISVCQKAYGTGVSRKLLDFVEKNAKKHSLPVLELIVHKDNLRAIQFYKKTGFKEIQPSGQRIGVNNKIFQKQIQISKMASLENW